MKRMRKLLLVMLLIPSLLVGCGGGSDAGSGATAGGESSQAEAASQTSQEESAAANPGTEASPAGETKTKLVMATEAGFRPFEYYEGNEIVGVDVDIAKAIAEEMGLELVVEHMEFGSIIPAVDSGKADFGAAGLSITEERKQQVDFTVEYATSKQIILTKADSGIMEDTDLDGKNVGVQLGTVADLALTDDYPNVKVAQYNKYMEATNDLINGRIDAIVLDVLPAQELLAMDENLVIREKELFTDVYAFCVKKGNTELLETINKVMQRLLDEGKIEEFTATHSAE